MSRRIVEEKARKGNGKGGGGSKEYAQGKG